MKAVSKSVSLPGPFWAVIEKHAPTTPGHDRSGYIRSLVEADLGAAGKLPGGDTHDEAAELLSLAEEIGLSAALETLRAKLRTVAPAA